MSWFDTIYADNDISAHAKAIYMYLKHHGNTEGKSFPSVPTMARELHLSQSSVRRALTELVEHRYEVENARDALTALVGRGVPYDSEEMRLALERFQVADAKWKEMEQGYLELRNSILQI